MKNSSQRAVPWLWPIVVWLLSGLLPCFAAQTDHAQTDHITQKAVWEDRSGTATLQEAKLQSFTPFDNLLSGGYGNSAMWLKVSITPDVSAPAAGRITANELIVRIRPSFLDEVELFDPLSPSTARRLTGDLHSNQPAEYVSLNLNFVIPRGDQPRDIYLRVKTTSTRSVSVEVLDLPRLLEKDRQQGLIYATLLAAATLYWVWALYQRMNFKDVVVSAFVLQQLMTLLWLVQLYGLLRIIFPTGVPPWLDVTSSMTAFLLVTTSALFNYFLLNDYRVPKWTLRILLVVAGLFPLNVVLYAFGHTSLSLSINASGGVALGVFSLLASVLSRPKLNPTAPALPKFLIVIIYCLGNFFTVAALFMNLGLFPGTELALEALPIHALVIGALMVLLLQLRTHQIKRMQADIVVQLARSEATLQQAKTHNSEQKDFLQMLMHELKTPLAVVGMAIEAQAEHDQALRLGNKAIRDMQAIIERCIDTERFESGGYQVQFQAVNLISLVKQAIAAYPGYPLLIEAAATLPNVNVDAQMLQIVLNNIIENACKYSQANSPIDLTLVEKNLPNHGRGIQLEVANRPGRAGFPDEHQLFTKYYRSAGATSQSGTGLGLFLAHKLSMAIKAQPTYTADAQRVKFSLWLPV